MLVPTGAERAAAAERQVNQERRLRGELLAKPRARGIDPDTL